MAWLPLFHGLFAHRHRIPGEGRHDPVKMLWSVWVARVHLTFHDGRSLGRTGLPQDHNVLVDGTDHLPKTPNVGTVDRVRLGSVRD
jgi:hypothetical protein